MASYQFKGGLPLSSKGCQPTSLNMHVPAEPEVTGPVSSKASFFFALIIFLIRYTG